MREKSGRMKKERRKVSHSSFFTGLYCIQYLIQHYNFRFEHHQVKNLMKFKIIAANYRTIISYLFQHSSASSIFAHSIQLADEYKRSKKSSHRHIINV